MARYSWDPRSARFRDLQNGRYVARLQVVRWADAVLDASPTTQWASDVAAGRVSVGDWQQWMRQEIKRNYLEQYLAGRGGTGPMTFREYGSIGGMLREQYRYLDRFAAEVATGELSEGRIAARAQMYINSAREARERAARRAAEEARLDEVKWVWWPEAEHCEDCKVLNDSGWQKAEPWPFRVGDEDQYPGSGGTTCLTNCKCHLEWRKSRRR